MIQNNDGRTESRENEKITRVDNFTFAVYENAVTSAIFGRTVAGGCAGRKSVLFAELKLKQFPARVNSRPKTHRRPCVGYGSSGQMAPPCLRVRGISKLSANTCMLYIFMYVYIYARLNLNFVRFIFMFYVRKNGNGNHNREFT